MNPLYANLPTTIFERMSVLAREHGAINLGQGFPEADGPLDVREAAARAVIEGPNQYPSMLGLPELREAVAKHYKHWQGVDLDWTKEVTITSGATEALAAAIFALVSPGDEVVLLQPLYDAYLPLVQRAGGVAKFVRLTPPDWRIDEDALARAFSPKTKLVILNNPLNPTATVYGTEDLKRIADFCVRHDAYALCDEVWEHVVFDGRAHQTMLAVPGMRERTVKVGSAGKMFGLTGWKVGFVCAAPRLSAVVAKAHQFLTFTTPPNLQRGAAYGLGKDDAYFLQMRAELAASRDRLTGALEASGFAVLPSAGTYFLSIDLPRSGVAVDDETFCLRAVAEAGVAAIPMSAFYAQDAVRTVARLCFAKGDATLDEGAARLARARDLFR